jgi:hypothetical protein
MAQKEREAKKLKTQKRADRMEEIDKLHEQGKNQWQKYAQKVRFFYYLVETRHWHEYRTVGESCR